MEVATRVCLLCQQNQDDLTTHLTREHRVVHSLPLLLALHALEQDEREDLVKKSAFGQSSSSEVSNLVLNRINQWEQVVEKPNIQIGKKKPEQEDEVEPVKETEPHHEVEKEEEQLTTGNDTITDFEEIFTCAVKANERMKKLSSFRSIDFVQNQ